MPGPLYQVHDYRFGEWLPRLINDERSSANAAGFFFAWTLNKFGKVNIILYICIITLKQYIMRFFQSVLKEISEEEIIKHCYPIHHNEITLEERMGDGKCPDCDCDSWILLPKESVSVREGGKDYCECMNCGYMTHL